MSKVGVGLIGCGTIALHHLEGLANTRDTELVATMDVVPERARDLAEKYGAKAWYGSLEKFLANKHIDLVIVATPTGRHAEAAIASAQAGKHVLVEKPMAVTLHQADLMIAAAREAGVKLGCVFQRRFDKASILLKEQLEAGRFGRLVLGNAYVKWYRTQSYYDAGGWRGTWAMDGGGALSNQSIHTIDLLQWTMGAIKTVYAQIAARTHTIETEDVGVASIRFLNGALGTIEGSTSIYPGPTEGSPDLYPGFTASLHIFGERGSVKLDGHGVISMWKFADDPQGEAEVLRRFSEPEKPPYQGLFRDGEATFGHQKQIEDMVQAIREDREPMITGEEGRKALELLRAIYHSATRGQPISVPLTERDESPRPVLAARPS